MIQIGETWICNFLKANFNHSTKVIGMLIWTKTNGGKNPFVINWEDLSDATCVCRQRARFCLNQLKKAGLITIEHKYKTPTITITLVK